MNCKFPKCECYADVMCYEARANLRHLKMITEFSDTELRNELMRRGMPVTSTDQRHSEIVEGSQ